MERRETTQAGMVIGDRYSIVAPLAEGGFGRVYVAEQITTERRVALKLLSPIAGDSTEYMLGEARIASRLQSENIVQIVDAGIDHTTGLVFVVMDLLKGSTLDDLVEAHGPLPPATALDYLRQIANGLDKAHTHVDRDGHPAPIVHRDLKPGNVFVTRRDDGTALLKILDFGTAKILSSKAASSRIVRGTPMYMAPEQLAGDRPTPATDLWAFGLVAFTLLTARSYWLSVARDAPAEALFNEIHSLPLVKASQRARELGITVPIDPDFDAWFARCLQRNPGERLASASQAADELTRALAFSIRRAASTSAPRGMSLEVFVHDGASKELDKTTSAVWHPQRPARSRRWPAFLVLGALAALSGLWFATRFRASDSAAVASGPPSATSVAPNPTPPKAATLPEAPAARVLRVDELRPLEAENPADETRTRRAPVRAEPARSPRSAPPPRSTPKEPAPENSRAPKPNVYELR